MSQETEEEVERSTFYLLFSLFKSVNEFVNYVVAFVDDCITSLAYGLKDFEIFHLIK